MSFKKTDILGVKILPDAVRETAKRFYLIRLSAKRPCIIFFLKECARQVEKYLSGSDL
jgi:hypothetical protein